MLECAGNSSGHGASKESGGDLEMMKRVTEMVIVIVVAAVAIVSMVLRAQDNNAKPAPTLKSVLLQQLKDTHTNSNWFVCADVALAGVTPEQANWTDGKGNHSVGQLAYHIWFWNERNLRNMRASGEIQRQQRRNLRQVRREKLERNRTEDGCGADGTGKNS
jgi:hypothetical protein